MKKQISLCILSVLLALPLCLSAQRSHIPLERSVVAVNNGSGVTITWRRLAQEPEDTRYNVYANGKLLNSQPLAVSNLTVTTSQCPEGASLTVTSVTARGESQPSAPFKYRRITLGSSVIQHAYLNVSFSQAGSPLPDDGTFTTKFCWPVDLDGDGLMDYVVNRSYTGKDFNGYEGWGPEKLGGDCLEGYSSAGKHLWTVDLGVNTISCMGQNDGMTVGDFDSDGLGEVIVQLAEGARFWDSTSRTWGKYLSYNTDGTKADIDGDGMTNYTYYSKGRNPQWYFAVIHGTTGAQKDVCLMTMPSDGDMSYTRTNKSAFMNDEYPYPSPAMGTAYLDGVHQSAVAQFQLRTQNGTHHYFTYAYGYQGGEFRELWRFRFHDYSGLSEFHHIRIADVDGDGCDEVLNGQCAVDHNGKLLWTSGIAHGDRFRVSDIDPDHPGQEVFAIQQNAGDMLGMIIYDATTGKALKKWYLSAVGDVGRGECMDVDPKHKGYEVWSTMENIYDCKGNQIGTQKPSATEGIWWDGDLGREALITSGSGNNCPPIIGKYTSGSSDWSRLYQIGRESAWQIVCEYGVRPMFWGDITGDWREELVLKQLTGGIETGFVCLSSGVATSTDNIYCLLQDPGYFGQITNRGYYQSPNTSFYLGYDMPRPPLPPFMSAGQDSEVFGLTLGNATITPDAGKQHIYVMPVLGQTLTIGSPLQLPKGGELWKSQEGTLVIAAPISLSSGEPDGAALIISQGTVIASAAIDADVHLRARGTLSGTPTVNGRLIIEGSLNSQGCRLIPQGTMTLSQALTVDQPLIVELQPGSSLSPLLSVQGDVLVTSTLTFSITGEGSLTPGEYPLLSHSGQLTGLDRMQVEGLSGLKYRLTDVDNTVRLVIEGQRDPATGVVWTGAESRVWDYQTNNWTLSGQSTGFVAGDEVTFGDQAQQTTVQIDEMMPVAKVHVEGSKSFTFQGDGGLTGTCQLIKSGSGSLTMNITRNDFTGGVSLLGGIVTVKDLADNGIASSLGASGTINFGRARLVVNNSNTATDRSITLSDSASISITSGTTALKGVLSGKGQLTKTGAGQLNINNSANSWTGGTVLNAGTLAQGSWNARIGAPGSTITVTGNSTYKMFDSNSSSTMPSTDYIFDIQQGRTLTLYAGSRCNVNGTLRGKGTYRISLPYVRADISTNCSQFQGTYDVLTSNCRFVQAIDLSQATLNLQSAAYVAGLAAGGGTERSYTHKIGALTGSGTLSTSTWNVGYLDTDHTFAGTLNANAVVGKYGTGTWTLTGSSAAPITVYAGALQLNNATSTTTGSVTVRSGALVGGTGTAASITVQGGGIIKPGKNTGTATSKLTLTGNLTVQSGGILEFRARVSTTATCRTDALNVSGSVSLASPVIRIVPSGENLREGNELPIFTGSLPKITGTPTFSPATPGEGLLWDASDLATTGILRVIQDPETSINDIESERQSQTLYDLSGRRADSHQRGGIVIIRQGGSRGVKVVR